MAETLLLNGAPLHFLEHDFPMLIHGVEGSGASYFTMSVLAELFRKGKGIIMLSGYSHARDAFFTMTRAQSQTVLIEDDSSLQRAEHKRVIFLKREKAHYLPLLLEHITDSKKRVVLVKNVEMFPDPVFTSLLHHEQLIISGNIDESPLKFKILGRHFQTKVYFSPLLASEVQLPQLPQYGGYMIRNDSSGIVSVRSENLMKTEA